MMLSRALVVVAVGIAVVTGAAAWSAAPGLAAGVAPSPSPANVTVLIPGTNSPSPSPSASSGGSSSGGSSGGGSSSGGGPGGDLPTDAFGAPIPPAEPTKNASGLKLDHESISVKEWMIATGTGFTPGEKVQFAFYPGATVIGSFVADAGGSIKARFRIPEDMRLGTHVVEATGWLSKHVANAEFTVVSVAVAGGLPFLWWLIVVLGVLLAGLISIAVYFRHSITRWFGGGLRPAEPLP